MWKKLSCIESNIPYLFYGSNIVSSNSEHIGFGPFECRATPEITKWLTFESYPKFRPVFAHYTIHYKINAKRMTFKKC